MRAHAFVLVLAGLAFLVFGAARLLVERLSGSTPWTPAAYGALGLVLVGLLLAGAGLLRLLGPTRR